MIKKIELKIGEKYTIYSLSGIASTLRKEVKMTDVTEPEFRPSFLNQKPSLSGNWRLGAYKEFRKRTAFYLTITPTIDLIIPGWNHLKTDSEKHNSFSGNACLNISGTVEEVKTLIDKNINPNFRAYDTILAWPKPHTEMKNGDGLECYSDTAIQILTSNKF